MSKIEKTKAILDFLKTIILSLLVGLFGMISYLVINIETLLFIQSFITTLGILLDILVLFLLIKFTIKKINELEEL